MKNARYGVLVLLLALPSMFGCSGEQKLVLSEAKLEGSITYKGKPVPYALIIVSVDTKGAGSGSGASGFADKSGKFLIENVPAGPVAIGVNTDAGRGNMMGATMSAAVGGEKSAAPTFIDVPKKYFDPESSGIKTTVENPKGLNTFDIKIN
ncbi:MAG: hypothetical protein NTU79_12390 [Planctomycetota bacterium]|nr:hypothetical protein [Planctomycetota bacterium]